MADWVRKEFPGIDGRRQTELFVDYFRAAPGQKGVKLDWIATWRNWMRKADEYAAARPGHLRAVPAPALELHTFEDYRSHAAGPEAARLLGCAYIPREQPPSDKTPPQQWRTERAVEFIDDHEAALRAALTERRTG